MLHSQPASLLGGFRLPLEAGRLLLGERSLWAPAAAPAGLSLLAFSVAVSLLVGYAGELYGWATAWMPTLEAVDWYAWLWIGPGKAALALLGLLLFAAIAGAVLLVSFLLANILASPFLDVLSQRVERIESGEVSQESELGWKESISDGLRSLREELRRTAFFITVVGSLTLIGILIPGSQLLTGPAMVGFAIFFLPLDYASYTLDRRQISFRQKRLWLSSNKAAVAGFGSAGFLTCLVPGLNFFAMPLLVVAGTLLALRHPPAQLDPPSSS
jgi:uncharacterized protein involved in cysteine biosynthesis